MVEDGVMRATSNLTVAAPLVVIDCADAAAPFQPSN
jgi:hypothetical protein